MHSKSDIFYDSPSFNLPILLKQQFGREIQLVDSERPRTLANSKNVLTKEKEKFIQTRESPVVQSRSPKQQSSPQNVLLKDYGQPEELPTDRSATAETAQFA